MNVRKLIVLHATLSLLPSAALAQTMAIDWSSIDGGGGTIGSEQTTLVATIGQPDAARLTGATLMLQGGFIPGLETETTCSGDEFIRKASCRTRDGEVRKVVVVVKSAAPGQSYDAMLDSGQMLTRVANANGKVKFRFRRDDAPACGPNGVTVCDLYEMFDCGC